MFVCLFFRKDERERRWTQDMLQEGLESRGKHQAPLAKLNTHYRHRLSKHRKATARGAGRHLLHRRRAKRPFLPRALEHFNNSLTGLSSQILGPTQSTQHSETSMTVLHHTERTPLFCLKGFIYSKQKIGNFLKAFLTWSMTHACFSAPHWSLFTHLQSSLQT